MTERYAVYAAPGVGRSDATGLLLRERAESWLGRSVTGRSAPRGVPSGWQRNTVDRLTNDARRYGFHGTLKAPFRLADGVTISDVADATAALAATQPRVTAPNLIISRLSGFYALTPYGDASALRELAGRTVTDLEPYRAPLTAAEYVHRKPDTLTPRQRELLDLYGYPYVLDEFRFHLTLTDRIPDHQRGTVEQALQSWFRDCINRDVCIGALALFVEPAPGAPFRLHSLHPLEGSR